jgi:hypothetical protein
VTDLAMVMGGIDWWAVNLVMARKGGAKKVRPGICPCFYCREVGGYVSKVYCVCFDGVSG